MVGRKLYVGNLAYQVGDADLEQLFSEFGTVQSATGHSGSRHGPEQGVRLRGDGQRR